MTHDHPATSSRGPRARSGGCSPRWSPRSPPDGSLDLDGAARLATYLVDEQGNDAPGDQRHHRRVADHHRRGEGDAAPRRRRGGRRPGPGRRRGRHQRHPRTPSSWPRAAEKAGARRPAGGHAVLQQAAAGRPAAALHRPSPTPPACRSCSTTSRTGPASPIATETLCRLAEHERIVGVKDAKGDLTATSWVLSRTDLAYYSGDDALTLPLLSVGGVGVVGTSTHFTGAATKDMIEAYERGDVADALRPAPAAAAAVHRHLPDPGHDPGQGRPAACAACRPARSGSPLVDATDGEIDQLRATATRRTGAASTS